MSFIQTFIKNNYYIFIYLLILTIIYENVYGQNVKLNGILYKYDNIHSIKNEIEKETKTHKARNSNLNVSTDDDINNEKVFNLIKDIENRNAEIHNIKKDIKQQENISNDSESNSEKLSYIESETIKTNNIDSSLLKKISNLNNQKVHLTNSPRDNTKSENEQNNKFHIAKVNNAENKRHSDSHHPSIKLYSKSKSKMDSKSNSNFGMKANFKTGNYFKPNPNTYPDSKININIGNKSNKKNRDYDEYLYDKEIKHSYNVNLIHEEIKDEAINARHETKSKISSLNILKNIFNSSKEPPIQISNQTITNHDNMNDFEEKIIKRDHDKKYSSKKYPFLNVDQDKIKKVTDDIKFMKRNNDEYIDVQFVRPENNYNQLKTVYVKKKLPSANQNLEDHNQEKNFEKREKSKKNSKIQKRRELIQSQSLKRLKQKKRSLDISENERKSNSKYIISDLLIFDYFCDYGISEELCNSVEETLKKCSQYIQKMVTIKKSLYITIDYYPFCLNEDCSKRSTAVASSSPSCLYILSDPNGIEWSFPRSLYKQIYESTPDSNEEEEDIYVQINNKYEFYFGDSDKFSTDYRDLLYILLHEITHGLGFLSFWDTTFSKDFPEVFNKVTKSNGDYLVPQAYYSTDTDSSIIFNGWVPLCIFDRYLMYHEEYAPIYNLYLDVINSSRDILRKNGGRLTLKKFITEYESDDNAGYTASKFLYNLATGKSGSISFGIPSDEAIEQSFQTEFKYLTISKYIPLQSFCNFWSSSSSISHIDYSFIDSSDFLMVYMAKKGKSLNLLINDGVDYDGWDIKEPEDGIYPIWGPDTQNIMRTLGWNVIMENRQVFNRNIAHADNQCEFFLAKSAAPKRIHQFLNKTFFIIYIIFGLIYFIY